MVLAIVAQRPYKWNCGKAKTHDHVIVAARATQNGTVERGVQQFLDQSPRVSAMLRYSIDNISLCQAFDRGAGFMATKLAVLLGGSITSLIQIVIMLFLLFFLYRDRDLGLTYLRSIIPLNDGETNNLLSHINDTVQETVLGHCVVAAIQGLVAGITFGILGVPGASLLGIATVLFAMRPSFGGFVVWLPVAIYLAATHHWIQATIVVGAGSLSISTLDNFLYSILVGTQLRLHTVPIFLSILGGIWFFGVSGLILGPIAFTLAESFLELWRRRVPFRSLAAGPIVS